VQNLNETIRNREEALLVMAESMNEKNKIKKEKMSPKSKSATKKRKAAATSVAKKLTFNEKSPAEPAAKKARFDDETVTLRERVRELEELYRAAENRANYLEGELKTVNLRIADKDKEIGNYLGLLVKK
jgi:hypothetical protein